MPSGEATIRRLEKEMKEASKMLEFEYAALLRDQIIALRGRNEDSPCPTFPPWISAAWGYPLRYPTGKGLAPSPDYDVQQWLFVPNEYTEYRYILGTRGKKPLICIGINPPPPGRGPGPHPCKAWSG